MTRDSILLWIGMIGAILTALANQADLFPPEWKGYISMAALIVGVISGKLATSPLPGKNDAAKVDVSKLTPILLNVLLLPGLVGCAKKKPVIQADQGVISVLGMIQDTELILHTTLKPGGGPIIPDAAHLAFCQKLDEAWTLAKDFNHIVRDWPVGTPKPASVGVAALAVTQIAKDLLAMIPASPEVAKVVAYIQSLIAIAQPFLAGEPDPSPDQVFAVIGGVA